MPILKASDLLVLSSDYEGLPVVLFEAAVLGVPFVATNVPGARCFCEDYGGMLTEPSVLGVLKGMEAFERGECKAPKIDCRENNRKSWSCLKPFCRRPETKEKTLAARKGVLRGSFIMRGK